MTPNIKEKSTQIKIKSKRQKNREAMSDMTNERMKWMAKAKEQREEQQEQERLDQIYKRKEGREEHD
jgi:hypothetical protein